MSNMSHQGVVPDEPQDDQLTDQDKALLRRSIELSVTARDRGNRPFGAVIALPDGVVLAEAWNNTFETKDCTGHAETAAIRIASPMYSREVLSQATMYASGEPCVMCAGAIFWSNIRRVVFGIDAIRLRHYRGERQDQRDAELSCRDVFDASPDPFDVVGPALLDEASAPHEGVWKS